MLSGNYQESILVPTSIHRLAKISKSKLKPPFSLWCKILVESLIWWLTIWRPRHQASHKSYRLSSIGFALPNSTGCSRRLTCYAWFSSEDSSDILEWKELIRQAYSDWDTLFIKFSKTSRRITCVSLKLIYSKKDRQNWFLKLSRYVKSN